MGLDWLKDPVGAAKREAERRAREAASSATTPAAPASGAAQGEQGGMASEAGEIARETKFKTAISTSANIINGTIPGGLPGPGIGNDKIEFKNDKGPELLKTFLTKALDSLSPEAGAKTDVLKALNEYVKSKGLPEITDLKDITGKHLGAVVEGLRESKKLDFEQTKPGKDSSFIFAYVDVIETLKTSLISRVPFAGAVDGLKSNSGPRPAAQKTSAVTSDVEGDIVYASAADEYVPVPGKGSAQVVVADAKPAEGGVAHTHNAGVSTTFKPT